MESDASFGSAVATNPTPSANMVGRQSSKLCIVSNGQNTAGPWATL
ncbi:hypothetical protein ACWCPT_14230 [Streptomyces sp. NPDC002308]